MEYGLVALWLALYLLLGYVGGTVAVALFPRFPDRGIAFGVPVGITIIWTITYAVGRVSITAGVWVGLLVLIGAALLAATRRDRVDRNAYIEVSLVFTAAFLFVVVLRAFDPAISPLGGEKFLDYGLLKSLLRGDTLPPQDMWFAGEPVAYYYGGHLIASILTRLTGTPGQYAYNLALAGFYATLVTATYGLAGAIVADRDIPRRLAAGLGAFCVGIASNLSTPAGAILWLLPKSTAQSIADAAGYELTGLAAGRDQFSYWDASRVITDDPGDFATYEPAAAFVINEFPLFSWLNGDMHAHMMSTGFLVLTAAVCFSYYQTPEDDRNQRLALLFGVIPIIGGLIAVTNTWSFPAVGGLTVLTVAMAPSRPVTLLPASVSERVPIDSPVDEGRRIAVAITAGISVVLLGVVWSLPFWFGTASGREIAFLPDRSGIVELFAVHGLFVLPFGLYLYARTEQKVGTRRAGAFAVGAIGFTVLGALVDVAAVGLVGPLLVGAWLLARWSAVADTVGLAQSESEPGVGFETVVLVAGAGLVILVEFIFLKENIGRMNTVFKTYMQVWVFWGVAVGPVLAWALTRWRRDDRRVRMGVSVCVVCLLCAVSVYGVFAVSDHIDGKSDPTLDGTAYLDRAHPEEADAIRWMDTTISGQPTIVTAAPAGYHWNPEDGDGASAPSSLTGLPTVAGWTHEAQYRNETVYQQRVADVQEIYTGSVERQRTLLEQYDVEYVYVGPVERARYGEITIGSRQGVIIQKEIDGVVIYRVDHEILKQRAS
jgi:YYY domain-containing protein